MSDGNWSENNVYIDIMNLSVLFLLYSTFRNGLFTVIWLSFRYLIMNFTYWIFFGWWWWSGIGIMWSSHPCFKRKRCVHFQIKQSKKDLTLSNQKMRELFTSEMSVIICHAARRNIPEYLNFQNVVDDAGKWKVTWKLNGYSSK